MYTQSERDDKERLFDKLRYVLSDNDFSLDINDEQNSKVLCLGNNPKNSLMYGTASGLFNVTVSSLVNQKGRRKLGFFLMNYPPYISWDYGN